MHATRSSIFANGDEFAAYVGTLDVRFDVVCSSETWLSDEIAKIDKFAGYRSFIY